MTGINLEDLTIQTFNDSNPDDRSIAEIFPYNLQQIEMRQQLCPEMGFFWCINPQINKSIRKVINTSRFERIGLDLDVAKQKDNIADEDIEIRKQQLLEKVLALPIKPTGIIESKNGFHPYWIFSDPIELETEEKRNQYNDFYQRLIKKVAEVSGLTSEGDNLVRVLRLPETYHKKDPEHPFLIKQIFEGETTTLAEFLKIYPVQLQQEKFLTDQPKKPSPDGDFIQLASQYGWSIVFDLHENEHRDWNGKSHEGRDSLLTAVSTSVFNRLPGDQAKEMILWLNSKMADPFPEQYLEKWFEKQSRWVKINPPFKPTSTEEKEIKPKNLRDVIETRIQERVVEQAAPKTGYPELDSLITGFIPGHLYTLSGETNLGKTSLACNFAVHLARQKRRTLYLALEPDSRLVDYIASIETKKPFRDLNDEDLRNINEYIDFTGGEVRTIEDLAKVIEQVTDRYSLVVIDHLGYFVRGSGDWISQQEDLLKGLARLTKDRRVPILIIAHLSKPAQGSENKTPGMDRIKGSSAFKQDSTEVLLLVRKKTLVEDNGLNIEVGMVNSGWLMVLKQKSGSNGSVPLNFAVGGAYITTPESEKNDSLTSSEVENYLHITNRKQLTI